MEMRDVLEQMGGLQSMARELGVTESQAAAGADALIPAILGGFKKQAQSQASGLEGLSCTVTFGPLWLSLAATSWAIPG